MPGTGASVTAESPPLRTGCATAALPASAATGANDFGNSLALGDGFLAVGAPRSYAKGNENADEDDAPEPFHQFIK